jgi:hypothetical protein
MHPPPEEETQFRTIQFSKIMAEFVFMEFMQPPSVEAPFCNVRLLAVRLLPPVIENNRAEILCAIETPVVPVASKTHAADVDSVYALFKE